MNRRVLVVAYSFPPSARAGVHRTIRFVRYLSEFGWDITVLTPAPKHYREGERLDDGLMKKVPDAVRVEHTRLVRVLEALAGVKESLSGKRSNQRDSMSASSSPSDGGANSGKNEASVGSIRPSLLARLKQFFIDLLTLPDKEAGWIPFAVMRGLRLKRAEGFHAIYTTGPPHSCHLIGYWLKRLTGRPWVADFRDPWARSPWKMATMKGTFRWKSFEYFERLVARSADRVILNTPNAGQDFLEHYDHLVGKFEVITNGFDPQDFGQINGHVAPKGKRLVITHTGALYRKRSPESLFRALSELATEGRLSAEDLEVRFVGTIDAKFRKQLDEDEALQRMVTLVPPMSHSECLEVQAESHVLLAIQPDTSLTVPGKLYEYVAMRRKILAIASPGPTLDIVRDNELGITVDPEDVDAIKGAIMELVAEQRNGGVELSSATSRTAFETYDGRRLTHKLNDILHGICEKSELPAN